ncbi:hypothetical protein [Emcibacter nanhaiensis]|uniref:Uncharacterized protein n=1 Tax=Emcibacter nanhaiensis TaxID=1505037 RepID=A0A501PHN1_9PROT|nr:hypothetical protein [Emcibacter nanhaiensis]TPD59531.1 hypothetical protein FIV46_10620 [Emcibacter nanhaiensis]
MTDEKIILRLARKDLLTSEWLSVNQTMVICLLGAASILSAELKSLELKAEPMVNVQALIPESVQSPHSMCKQLNASLFASPTNEDKVGGAYVATNIMAIQAIRSKSAAAGKGECVRSRPLTVKPSYNRK